MNERAQKILSLLKKEYASAKCALNFKNPLEILVATILSAQCTDERVNIVTRNLFKKYKKAEDYARADIRELEKDIKSTGFYKNKARAIKESAIMIVKKFGGKVPKTMEELLTLRGVARKTANVVLGNAHGVVEGIVVDTHMRRVSRRLGLTKQTDPEKIEQDLMRLVPRKDWFQFSYQVISHGRRICKAPKPLCEKCVLNKICPAAFNPKLW